MTGTRVKETMANELFANCDAKGCNDSRLGTTNKGVSFSLYTKFIKLNMNVNLVLIHFNLDKRYYPLIGLFFMGINNFYHFFMNYVPFLSHHTRHHKNKANGFHVFKN